MGKQNLNLVNVICKDALYLAGSKLLDVSEGLIFQL